MQMIRNKDELIAYIGQGGNAKYLFFWGHQKPANGNVGKTCLSQWYEMGFELDGIYYPTAEHYMMAEKARLFNDTEMLVQILESSHPHAAKQLGRSVKGYDDKLWYSQRMTIVIKGNAAKFTQHEDL